LAVVSFKRHVYSNRNRESRKGLFSIFLDFFRDASKRVGAEGKRRRKNRRFDANATPETSQNNAIGARFGGKRASIAFGTNDGSNATRSSAVQAVKARLPKFLVVADRRDARTPFGPKQRKPTDGSEPASRSRRRSVVARFFRVEAAVLRLGNELQTAAASLLTITNIFGNRRPSGRSDAVRAEATQADRRFRTGVAISAPFGRRALFPG